MFLFDNPAAPLRTLEVCTEYKDTRCTTRLPATANLYEHHGATVHQHCVESRAKQVNAESVTLSNFSAPTLESHAEKLGAEAMESLKLVLDKFLASASSSASASGADASAHENTTNKQQQRVLTPLWWEGFW